MNTLKPPEALTERAHQLQKDFLIVLQKQQTKMTTTLIDCIEVQCIHVTHSKKLWASYMKYAAAIGQINNQLQEMNAASEIKID